MTGRKARILVGRPELRLSWEFEKCVDVHTGSPGTEMWRFVEDLVQFRLYVTCVKGYVDVTLI